MTRSTGRPSSFAADGEAADEGCVLGAFQEIAAGIVARMHEKIGRGDALREGAGRRVAFAAGAAIGVRGGREIGRADRLRVRYRGRADPRRRRRRRPARCRRCDRGGTLRRLRRAPRRGERIFLVAFIARGDGLHRRVDERDLRRKEIAEQAGNAPGDVDARAAHGGSRQHLDAGDAAAGVVPERPAAHQREALRDLLAAGAQRGAAPEVDDDRARQLAVRLQMRAHDLVGGEPAEVHGGRRRQGARIGGEEIAAGRQHVAPPARRRAGRAGRDAAAVERREQRRAFRRGALQPRRIVRCSAGARP